MNRKPFNIENLSIKNGTVNFSEEDLEKIRMIFVGTLIEHHYIKYKNLDVNVQSIRFNLVECGKDFISRLSENLKFFRYEFTAIDIFKLCNQMLNVASQINSEEI